MTSNDTEIVLRPKRSSGIPLAVYIVALIAAAVHAAPTVKATVVTPDGWTFTGNTNVSPDYMQYRVWSRVSQASGPVVPNTLTSEPNDPYLLVPLYWVIGQVSAASGVAPEFVYAYGGSVLAFVFVVFLWWTIGVFLRSRYQAWWVFVTILLGGGLGAHLMQIRDAPQIHWRIRQAIAIGFENAPPFEAYRSHYIFSTLFDTHFLLIWLTTLAAVMALYFSIRDLTWWRLGLTMILFALATLIHVYEGITIAAISVGVGVICWRHGINRRAIFLNVLGSTLAAATTTLSLWLLYRTSGFPEPPWRAPEILVTILLLAYPVAWVVILPGLRDYWVSAKFPEAFLMGWTLGCVTLTLSAPFYAYPARGTMTLQVALYIMAGMMYFRRYPRVSWSHALILVLFLGVTPVQLAGKFWRSTEFSEDKPWEWLSPDHQTLITTLQSIATPEDILLAQCGPAGKSDPASVLWLAPAYPGKHYCAHFFLTVDYQEKRTQAKEFLTATPEEQWAFLTEHGIRFLHLPPMYSAGDLEALPNVRLLASNTAGAILEVDHAVAAESNAGRGVSRGP